LKEALERLMERNQACLQAAAAAISSQPEPSLEKKADYLCQKTVTQQEKYSQAARQRRLERYQIVSDLHQLGQGVRAISRATGLAPKTVRKYLDAGSFPEWGTPTRRHLMITPYLPYLKQQWAKGQHNACQLYRDIKAQGFPGSRATVRRWGTKMRKMVITPSQADQLAHQAQATFARPCSTQYATWLLLANQPDLSSDKQTALDCILQTSSEVARAYNFAQAFLRIIRQHLSRALDPWLEAVLTYRVPGLVHFARGLKKDLPAVRAALTLPYSNGQVEGQVNRLKLIKRQMYGRANFDLLRLRVLAA
jgi:transposase